MGKEIKEIQGEVQDKTVNSLKVNNFWIKFFDTNLIKEIKLTDVVNISYRDNTKDNRTYHNGISIEKLGIVINSAESKINDTTVNTLLMMIKEIYIDSNERELRDVAKEVINMYNLEIKGKI